MKTILSIQSAVSVGAVGNTMANMVLTAMAFNIIRVDTIQLAAHPGYGFVAGGRLPSDDFTALIKGLMTLKIWDQIDAVMTGYMAHADQTEIVGELITAIKSHRPSMPVLIDPAIGDHGRLYVDAAVADGMANHLFPHADIITPNRFELEYFSGQTILSKQDAINASHLLMTKDHLLNGIAVTGINLDDQGNLDGWINHDHAVFHDGNALQHQPKGLSGGGDLFAAMVMGNYLKTDDWGVAVAISSTKAQSILHQSDAPGQAQILPHTIINHLANIDDLASINDLHPD